jgi:ankyrin repeat protein
MCNRDSAMKELLKYDVLGREEFVAAWYEHLFRSLLTSVFCGDEEGVSAIISLLDAVSIAGYTALHRAILVGYYCLVHQLIERGASVNAQSRDGRTPLHLAASKGVVGVVEELLMFGAQASVRHRSHDVYRHVVVHVVVCVSECERDCIGHTHFL